MFASLYGWWYSLCFCVRSSEVQNMAWLCKEAADRYNQMYKLRPVLTLSTHDGAILAPEELVSSALTDGEEVFGTVTSWNTAPLPTRYTEACRQLKCGKS